MFTQRETAMAQTTGLIEDNQRAEAKQTEMTWTNVKVRRRITPNCVDGEEFKERRSRVGPSIAALMATQIVMRGAR